jgi:dihydrofolate synthase/folylpolyglutamate synthase
MNFDQAVEYLDGLTKFPSQFGLARITALSRAFGDPHRALRVIHVGGTNGKGSTATFAASILREAGYRVGLYLSPYVHDLRERIQINGRMIPRQDFADIVSEIQPIAEDLAASNLGEINEFEVKTMAAYLHFAREKVDFAVLEVGIGGRFDATNIVSPLVAIITNVSLDHTERLGKTVDKIAFEKAGIIKTGSVLVTAVDDPEAWRVILKRARQEGAEVWRVTKAGPGDSGMPSADVQLRYLSKSDGFSLHGGGIHMVGLRPGLAGRFQHVNAATAVAAISAMTRYEVRIPERAIKAGVANAYIPGRLEVLLDSPKLVIDGAHNPAAARHLAGAIGEAFDYKRLILVVGMLTTHPADGFLAEIAPLASKIVATQSGWYLASPAEQIGEEARRYCDDVEVVPGVQDAVARALQAADKDDLVLVTGSLYTIGEVRMES